MKSLKWRVLPHALLLFFIFTLTACTERGYIGATVVAKKSANQKVGVKWEAVAFDDVEADIGGIFDPATNTRLTVPVNASLVKLCASVTLDVTTTGPEALFKMRFFKNGNTDNFNGNAEFMEYFEIKDKRYFMSPQLCTAPTRVVDGDFFEIKYLSLETVGLVRNGRRTWFSMEILE